MRPKNDVKEFNGAKYYRKPNGYYQRNAGGKRGYLHRDVWEFHHGPIPGRYQIHHKDHDRSNCNIENLELLTTGCHLRYHWLCRHGADHTVLNEYLGKAREAAGRWHKSELGREWHRKHAKRAWEQPRPVERVCPRCGKKHVSDKRVSKRGFCSAACQSAFRRASRKDNVDRVCGVCSSIFSANRYSKVSTCSRKCGGIQGAEKRTRVRAGC